MEQRFYRLGELAKMYKISSRTLQRRLEPIYEKLQTVGIDEDGEPIVWNQRIVLYSPKQIKMIFEFLGEPTMEV
jgi:hypothetical protein